MTPGSTTLGPVVTVATPEQIGVCCQMRLNEPSAKLFHTVTPRRARATDDAAETLALAGQRPDFEAATHLVIIPDEDVRTD